MKLLAGEERKIELANVFVTNYRIIQKQGSSHMISIFLENISSIEMHFKSNLWSLILAFIVPLSVFGLRPEYIKFSLVAALFFLLYYIFSRRHILGICSNGGSVIEVLIKGNSSADLDDFIAELDGAKLKRVNELLKTTNCSTAVFSEPDSSGEALQKE